MSSLWLENHNLKKLKPQKFKKSIKNEYLKEQKISKGNNYG